MLYKPWLGVPAMYMKGASRYCQPGWLGEPPPLYRVCAHRVQLSKVLHLLRECLQVCREPPLAAAPWR